MKINNRLGFVKLGPSFSSFENEIIEISRHLEVELESFGEPTDLTLDKIRNIGNRIDSKIIMPCLKYEWTDSIPYTMGRGMTGLEQTSVGNLKEYLIQKYNFLIYLVEQNGVNLTDNDLYLIDEEYLKNKSISTDKIAQSNDGACYIATLIYGSYNHSQVIVLRNFRDRSLQNNLVGRNIIHLYYYLSTKVVPWLKNQPYIQILIRRILDNFINLYLKIIRN